MENSVSEEIKSREHITNTPVFEVMNVVVSIMSRYLWSEKNY